MMSGSEPSNGLFGSSPNMIQLMIAVEWKLAFDQDAPYVVEKIQKKNILDKLNDDSLTDDDMHTVKIMILYILRLKLGKQATIELSKGPQGAAAVVDYFDHFTVGAPEVDSTLFQLLQRCHALGEKGWTASHHSVGGGKFRASSQIQVIRHKDWTENKDWKCEQIYDKGNDFSRSFLKAIATDLDTYNIYADIDLNVDKKPANEPELGLVEFVTYFAMYSIHKSIVVDSKRSIKELHTMLLSLLNPEPMSIEKLVSFGKE